MNLMFIDTIWFLDFPVLFIIIQTTTKKLQEKTLIKIGIFAHIIKSKM